MAREGLRTLVVAKKRLSEEAYEDFRQRYVTKLVKGRLFTEMRQLFILFLDTTKRKLAFMIVMPASKMS